MNLHLSFHMPQYVCKALAYRVLRITNQPCAQPHYRPPVPAVQTVSTAPTARQPLGAQWLRFLRIRRYARVSHPDPCVWCAFSVEADIPLVVARAVKEGPDRVLSRFIAPRESLARSRAHCTHDLPDFPSFLIVIVV